MVTKMFIGREGSGKGGALNLKWAAASGLSGQKGLEKRVKWWESCTMSATIVREKRQTTLPADVVEAAGIKVNDQVDWRFEDGEIRGRKLVPVADEVLDIGDVDARTLWSKGLKVTNESISAAVRADREGRK